MSRHSLLKGLPVAALAGLLAWSVPTRAQQTTVQQHAHFNIAEIGGARFALEAIHDVVRAATVINPRCAALRLRAERDVGAVAMAILGGYPARPRKSDGTETTRAEQLRVGWEHRDRALLGTLPDALACVDGHPSRPEWVQSADWLRKAIEHLYLVDTTLPYAEPAPQPLLTLTISDGQGGTITVTQTEYAVVGPHGLYYEAINSESDAMHYARDLQDVANKLLADPRYQSKRPYIRQVLAKHRDFMRWHLDNAAKIAGVSHTESEDRFCTMLYVLDTVTNGVGSGKPGLPVQLRALFADLAVIVTDDALERELLAKGAEMWTFGDESAWGIQQENEPLRKRCGLAPLEAR